jgi:hypothetical protein
MTMPNVIAGNVRPAIPQSDIFFDVMTASDIKKYPAAGSRMNGNFDKEVNLPMRECQLTPLIPLLYLKIFADRTIFGNQSCD